MELSRLNMAIFNEIYIRGNELENAAEIFNMDILAVDEIADAVLAHLLAIPHSGEFLTQLEFVTGIPLQHIMEIYHVSFNGEEEDVTTIEALRPIRYYNIQEILQNYFC